MLKLTAVSSALAFFFAVHVQAVPVASSSDISLIQNHGSTDWQGTLSNDTRHRLDLARQHLDDKSVPARAFRNDTIMRINIEREAPDLSLIDLSQAFDMTLPTSRASVTKADIRKRSNAEDFREEMYTRGGTMYWLNTQAQRRSNAEDFREEMHTRGGRCTRNNLALGAIERINIAHRILGQPELIPEKIKEDKQLGDEYISEYWNSSISYGGFWTTDQAEDKPNFIEGGQANGFGFTQSTFHKLHCLANLRMMLAWHITGNGDKMTRDMNVHAMHCLEYVRGRELMNPDLNEEPIDTVDYKGMGIH